MGLSKFGRGERFVYKSISRAEFDEVLGQVDFRNLVTTGR
jgi:hypothetical protein